MKKMLLTLLTVFMVLSMLSIPAHAEPPMPAAGLWQYKPSIEDSREADGNTFLTATDEGKWTGTFEGDSREDFVVMIHSSGFWSYMGLLSFEGTVNGKSGTLDMSCAGNRADVDTDWQGQCVILSGTGDLATLRGQVTWWGPGAPAEGEWGDIYYSGKIDFASD